MKLFSKGLFIKGTLKNMSAKIDKKRVTITDRTPTSRENIQSFRHQVRHEKKKERKNTDNTFDCVNFYNIN
jgi:hypothetical protein